MKTVIVSLMFVMLAWRLQAEEHDKPQSENTTGMTLQVSMVHKSYLVGEPVEVDVTFSNESDDLFDILLFRERHHILGGLIKGVIKSASGAEVDFSPTPNAGKLPTSVRIRMIARARYTIRLSLNPDFEISKPGMYSLENLTYELSLSHFKKVMPNETTQDLCFGKATWSKALAFEIHERQTVKEK